MALSIAYSAPSSLGGPPARPTMRPHMQLVQPVRDVSTKELEAYAQRFEQAKTDRQSWNPHWQELSDFILPRRWIFQKDQIGRGTKRNDRIINNTATRAVRICAAGMMAGITSPSRRWWTLTTPDPDMAEFGPVRSWLNVVEERQRMVLARSNIYNALSGAVYPDISTFGSTCTLLEEDDEDVLRAYPIAVGLFYLAASERGTIDTIMYEERLTVAQVVERFGLGAVSLDVKRMYDGGQYNKPVDILRCIEPNRALERNRADWRGMRWTSCWMEQGTKHCLRMSGYREFPGLTPRWTVTTAADAYGTSPAMDALGDIKALQLLEEDKARLVQKAAQPPLNVSEGGMALGSASSAPNAINVNPNGGQPTTPLMMVDPRAIAEVRSAITEHTDRINAAFYADLWLMLSMDDRNQRATAREIDERHEEKMLQLGPVLERLNDELLSPIIDRSFKIMWRRGMVPPPPRELQGQEIRVEFMSIMHQAQKLLGLAAVRTLVQETMSLATVWPEVRAKINADQVVDEIASMVGTKPDLVNPEDVVQTKRAAEAQQAQAQQAAAALPGLAKSAKDFSQAGMPGGGNALSEIMQQLPGAAGAASGVPPLAATMGEGQ